MDLAETTTETVTVDVSNVGGIDESTVSFASGVTALTGRNATNRTSFLRAVMAALGSENASLKGDADEGRVELAVGDETYTRTFERRNGTVVTGGEPYLADPTVADLFAFLLESNEARRAVARSEGLRDVIMRPVDTEAIREEIADLRAEKRRLDEERDRLAARSDDLPALERELERVEDELAEKRAALDETRAEIEALDADLPSPGERDATDEAMDRLREVREAVEDVRFDVETERESLDSLRKERADLAAELDDLPEDPGEELSRVEAEIERARDRKEALESHINDLRSIVSFNEGLVDGSSLDLQRALDGDGDAEVTDRLLDDERVTCWTCGNEVERAAIEETLERLRDLQQRQLDERSEVTAELDRLGERRSERREHRQRRRDLARRLDDVDAEIEEREAKVETLEERLDDLRAEAADLESEVEDRERDEYGHLLDRHKEANRLELEIDDAEAKRQELRDEVESARRAADRVEAVEERRRAVRDDLAECRTRIERIESEAVDAFNEHMNAVLDRLDYENFERIWIERRERTVREGRRNVERTTFDLHVVRSTASGTTYEDTVDHLSESEREVTGIVFALAGYLVHEVYDAVPFMLLDSLEAIDSGRIATLVDYVSEYAPFLIVALLPEDAAALRDEYERVTEI